MAEEDRVGLGEAGRLDQDIYGAAEAAGGYAGEVVEVNSDDEGGDDTGVAGGSHPATRWGAAKDDTGVADNGTEGPSSEDPFAAHREANGSGLVDTRISNRESEYHARRHKRVLSPARKPADGSSEGRSYREVMLDAKLDAEREQLLRKIQKKQEAEAEASVVAAQQAAAAAASSGAPQPPAAAAQAAPRRKRRRWDDAGPEASSDAGGTGSGVAASDATPIASRFDDATPVRPSGGVGSADATPRRNRWDETPVGPSGGSAWDETPVASSGGAGAGSGGGRKRSRWDETPVTDHGAAAAGGKVISATPAALTPAEQNRLRWERELDERNRPMTDDELDGLFPPGYKILEPPPNYQPLRDPSRKLLATPTPMGEGGFKMEATPARESYGVALGAGGVLGADGESVAGDLPFIKPEDYQYFGKLMEDVDEATLSVEEARERRIMLLLLKIKCGTPPQRKSSLRQISDKAREFGPQALFAQVLPLLMSPTLEDQERHLLVKVIDRILYKLDDLVRPYVHKILVVIEPLLIDEDYYARVEGREIISNLAKAAGLATMIATMRPDIDNPDEYVRNTTARAFAVVASALGIPALLPFLKAVCRSRKSWHARHTGVKIVQQIAILMGVAVLPHLTHLVDIIGDGLNDDQAKVRTVTALAVSALAEAAHPYGFDSFYDEEKETGVLKFLLEGIRKHRGKSLAAFLKAIGFIIPLAVPEDASTLTAAVVPTLIREFQSPDEEMKKIVLRVVGQIVATDGVTAAYVKEQILPEFFKNFWVRRMALDRRNYRAVVETTVTLADRVGCVEIVGRIVNDLKDESEPYRRMVMETIEQVVSKMGVTDVDTRLEELLIDGILFAFAEQASDETPVMLKGFGTVVNALGARAKPYLAQICGMVKWRLNNKSAKVRMQAADLVAAVANVMHICEEEEMLGHMGVVLYECLGEEYPEVLGSILGGLRSIVAVIGMSSMQPPIKDLLPRLTPILKNRHEKVQENCIDLVGRIADRGPEYVSAREWMRICFELLELLKAHKKAIRRATVNTFGYIAKAIGPQDVLYTLLQNLRVQERQNRVCTTVAIAIVAETCAPFTVLPALMNEYREPLQNVQNGVLKALSFLFEYIGEMGKDYIYAVTPLLEDALIDRDPVHRQTACTTVKHMALGVAGMGCEDALTHLLNHVWPNIFETSPHLIGSVFDAIEGMRVALGAGRVLSYVLQGLYHPARKVREVYWKLYNNLYVYAADALTPALPALDDEGKNTYRKTYMELFV